MPLQLRNAPTRLMKDLEYGKDYEYAHDTEEKLTRMECLPESLAGTVYYHPTDQGDEEKVKNACKKSRSGKGGKRKRSKKL